jgi:hypothetical protein
MTDTKGSPASCGTEIMVGEHNEGYSYVEPEVGNAINSLIIEQLRCGVASRPKRLSLRFYHDSHHFAHSKVGQRLMS